MYLRRFKYVNALNKIELKNFIFKNCIHDVFVQNLKMYTRARDRI